MDVLSRNVPAAFTSHIARTWRWASVSRIFQRASRSAYRCKPLASQYGELSDAENVAALVVRPDANAARLPDPIPPRPESSADGCTMPESIGLLTLPRASLLAATQHKVFNALHRAPPVAPDRRTLLGFY
ncbi:unnamed protein product, partial [Iphiclides podalirius]